MAGSTELLPFPLPSPQKTTKTLLYADHMPMSHTLQDDMENIY